ncbi:class I SAM-dependent methyltransferase [Xanthobacteraceae bacterium A53D]
MKVDVLDSVPAGEDLIFTGYYDAYTPETPYDYIWASHVLEHVPNPNSFAQKVYNDLKDGGRAAITVPPLKHEMTFAHMSLWNAGLLLMHFVSAGFDCSNAHIATYGYNCTLIAQKSKSKKRRIEKLPPKLKWKNNYFMGDIERIGWNTSYPRMLTPFPELRSFEDTEELLKSKPHESAFYQVLIKEIPAIAYWDSHTSTLVRAG